MAKKTCAVITGSGCYIPTKIIPNSYFMDHTFYDSSGKLFPKTNEEIIQRFADITGILERRYVEDGQQASDIGYLAADAAIKKTNIDPESLDFIIVAHNFGDVTLQSKRIDQVPALASRIKHKLNIQNPDSVAYDLPFGCAGWLQGVIQAKHYIESGLAKKILIVGTETISRIYDPHDRDCMIFSDGAGAIILEAKKSDLPIGILSTKAQTMAVPFANILRMGSSYNQEENPNWLTIKMEGRKLYEQVVKHVPAIMKSCLEAINMPIQEVSKFLIHQANHKMDEAILKHLFNLYGIKDAPLDRMPMTISTLGNSSVATLPTLYDLILDGKLDSHAIQSGDKLLFASVGAGINLNAMVYVVP